MSASQTYAALAALLHERGTDQVLSCLIAACESVADTSKDRGPQRAALDAAESLRRASASIQYADRNGGISLGAACEMFVEHPQPYEIECSTCVGYGRLIPFALPSRECPDCGGTGKVQRA